MGSDELKSVVNELNMQGKTNYAETVAEENAAASETVQDSGNNGINGQMEETLVMAEDRLENAMESMSDNSIKESDDVKRKSKDKTKAGQGAILKFTRKHPIATKVLAGLGIVAVAIGLTKVLNKSDFFSTDDDWSGDYDCDDFDLSYSIDNNEQCDGFNDEEPDFVKRASPTAHIVRGHEQ